MRTLASKRTRYSSKGSRRRPQQPAMSTSCDSDQDEVGIFPRPGAVCIPGNRPSENDDIVSLEDSATVSPPSVAEQDSVVRVPEAQLVDPAFAEAAVARAVQEAREEARLAVREELLRQEQRNEERQPVVQAELLQEKDRPHDTAEEEGQSTIRMPAFIRSHTVVSCTLCCLLLLGAVAAGLGVAFSSGEGGKSGSTSRSVPSSSPNTVESPPTPAPSPLDESTARTTPQPTKEPTLRPSPRPTPIPIQLPTVTPVVVNTTPPTPSMVDGISLWTRVGPTLTGVAAGDQFGGFNALALSSDGAIVAVGASGNDNVSSNAGYVQVLKRGGGGAGGGAGGADQDQAHQGWQPMGAALEGGAENDRFGDSVALSANGQILAVGADEFGSGRPGYVGVFEYDITNDKWNPRGSKIVGVAERDSFGRSVSLSFDGDTLAASAPGNDDNGALAGHVRVFEFDSNSNEWVQQGTTLSGVVPGDESGSTVDLSADGTILAVGAYLNDGNGANSGHVRVFQFNSKSKDWDPLGVAIPGAAKGDEFGLSVALSFNGTVLAAGARFNDDNGSNSGHVRVFDYNNSSNQWVQRGSVIVGVDAVDGFGWSVALSSDGNRLAAGAIWHDAIASYSGHIRVFQYVESSGDGTSTGQWKQVGGALTGAVGGVRDYFGVSVAMSADGTVVAGGAGETNADFLGPGYVCVYKRVVDE